MIVVWILAVIIACYWIMKACDKFEPASDFLGRNMAPGIKGATINAIGSSLPELFTTLIFLFVYGEKEFSSGVATTAGSAVFNAVIIPALVIISAIVGLV